MNQTKNASNFKEAFCAHFNCRPEDYVQKALFYVFYRHCVPISHILYSFRTVSIKQAIQAVEVLGRAADVDEVHWLINDYRYQLRLHHASSFVKLFKVRISGRRMLALFQLLEPCIQPSSKRLSSTEAG
jgi:hypothetical protein